MIIKNSEKKSQFYSKATWSMGVDRGCRLTLTVNSPGQLPPSSTDSFDLGADTDGKTDRWRLAG